MRQFYVAPDALGAEPAPGLEVRLPADESRHLLRVLRASVGDDVVLTDGRGHRLHGMLDAVDGREAVVGIRSVERDEAELARPRLVLACGVIKGKRWEWLLEKAVELGVHRIAPLLSRHAEVDPGAGRQRRWETILHTALKQSGRTWCPEISDPATPAVELGRDGTRTVCYGLARSRSDASAEGLLDPRDMADPDALFEPGAQAPDELVWCVGPEGGWSDDEIRLLADAGRAVRLGPHRLRAETAAAAGLLPLAAARERYLERT